MDQKSRDDRLRERHDRTNQLTNQVDHIPEILQLRFRYFDGQAWLDRWDSDAKKGLPVAIETGFEVESDYQVEIDKLINPVEAETTSDFQVEEETELTETVNQLDAFEIDDSLQTAQTMEVEIPNRFVIFLGRHDLVENSESTIEPTTTR